MRLWCFAFLVGLYVAEGAVLRAKREADAAAEDSGESFKRKKRGLLNEDQVSVNCRTVVLPNVTPGECNEIKLGELGGDPLEETLYGEANRTLSEMKGRCRYDPYQHVIDPSKACLCVATRQTCEKGRQGCYWYESKKTGHKECISKAEKFYNMLYHLLNVRGKKNFAINIRYGATAARGELPYGPYGPAVIGMGNPNPTTKFGVYKGKMPQYIPGHQSPSFRYGMHGQHFNPYPQPQPLYDPHRQPEQSLEPNKQAGDSKPGIGDVDNHGNTQFGNQQPGMGHHGNTQFGHQQPGMGHHGNTQFGHQQPGMGDLGSSQFGPHQMGMTGFQGYHGPGPFGPSMGAFGHRNPMGMGGHGMPGQQMGGPAYFGMHAGMS